MSDKNKEHLDIDLEFLDRKEPLRAKPIISEGQPKTYKFDWRSIPPFAYIIAVIIFFAAVGAISDSGKTPKSTLTRSASSSNYSNAQEDIVKNGMYNCTRYNSNQADLLTTTETESQMNIDQALQLKYSNEVERLKKNIDNSLVTEDSSQYDIDNYNEMIHAYNEKLSSYNIDATRMSARIAKYNAEINIHNNYLIAHCTKAY